MNKNQLTRSPHISLLAFLYVNLHNTAAGEHIRASSNPFIKSIYSSYVVSLGHPACDGPDHRIQFRKNRPFSQTQLKRYTGA